MKIELIKRYKVLGATFYTPDEAYKHVIEILSTDIYNMMRNIPSGAILSVTDKQATSLAKQIINRKDRIIELLSIEPYKED